jgi:Tol biopolymer transport system component
MFKKILCLFLGTSLALSACGTLKVTLIQTSGNNPDLKAPTPASSQTKTGLVDQRLSLESSSDAIREKMLTSALNWRSLWMDGTVRDNQNGSELVTRQQVWVDQATARFRFLAGPVDGSAQKFKVSDGISRLEMDIPGGTSHRDPLPQGIAGQFVPPFTPGVTWPNPIWSQIGERLAELAFPADFAQGEGIFTPMWMEIVADRPSLAVDWIISGDNLPTWRVWLDTETGIILKFQDFGKGGGDTVQQEISLDKVQYNIQLPPDLFNVSPLFPPDFSDVSGTLLTARFPTPAPTLTPQPIQVAPDPLGTLYFFSVTYGTPANLLRLPGSCVAGVLACPAVESISLPSATFPDFALSWAWSKDGKKVAFTSDPGIEQDRLFVAQLPDLTWKQIAQFQYDFIQRVTWSPDGNWISFGMLTASRNWKDFYVIHPDGSGLMNVTATDKLPAEGRPYIADGWIADNLLIHSAKPGHAATAYLLHVADGQVKLLFEASATNTTLYPSPDSKWLAFDKSGSSAHTLRVTARDGSGLHDLASFKTAISPLAWSPDANTLAFAAIEDKIPAFSSTAYVIGRDGSGLKKVYTGITTSLEFSPNGQFLLVEGGSQQQIFAIDVNSLETHTLKAPGLNLTDQWFSPAWNP